MPLNFMPFASSLHSEEHKQPVEHLNLLTLSHAHPCDSKGGVERFSYDLFNSFRRQPHITSRYLSATRDKQQILPGTRISQRANHCDEFFYFAPAYDYFLHSTKQPKYLRDALLSFLKASPVDVIHLHHFLHYGVEIFGLIKSILPEVKIVLTLHDFMSICHRDGTMVTTDEQLCKQATCGDCHRCFSSIEKGQFKARELYIQSLLACVDGFIAPSYFLAERYVAWGIAREKISVIANGISHAPSDRASHSSSRAQPNRLGYFGQISPYKGSMFLLDLADRLIDSDIEFHLHGKLAAHGDAFENTFMEKLETLDNVIWHGAYGPEALPHLMHAIDWVVCPSLWWENAPLVIDEAFHYGKPVIGTDIGGIREKVTHHKNGVLLPYANQLAWEDGLRDVTHNPKLHKKLSRQLPATTSIHESAAMHLTLYHSLVEPSKVLPQSATS